MICCPNCKSSNFGACLCDRLGNHLTCYRCQTLFYKDGVQVPTVCQLHQRIAELEQKLKFISENFNALYYAPGMPGYKEAQLDYNKK
jgi:hypothetical protein